jgi:hypothetical protein
MLLRTQDRTRPRGRLSAEVRRIAIAIAGCGVLGLGLVLIVVPVPGTSIVVFPLGFAILAKEFVWARRALARSRRIAQAFWTAVRQPSPGAIGARAG